MKKLLITGGAGFIGSNFIHYMLRTHSDIFLLNLDKLTYAGNLENLNTINNHPGYSFVQGDISDRLLVEELFHQYDFDAVVHFAAESHVDRSISVPGLFLDTNVGGTLSLLQCARESWYDEKSNTWKKEKKFVQISTDEVYGSLGAEGLFTEMTALDPHSPYSASKASADMFVKAFHDTYGMDVNITRCSNNYGPFQFPEKLIPLMIHNAIRHQPLPLYGDGEQIRDWLYVEDHCSAIDAVLQNGCSGEIYNVGGRNERSNLSIVKTILSILREELGDEAISESLIRHVQDRPGHDRRYGIDSSKIMKELGWQPQTPFEVGLRKTVRWYLNHPEWVEHITSGTYTDYYKTMYGKRLFGENA